MSFALKPVEILNRDSCKNPENVIASDFRVLVCKGQKFLKTDDIPCDCSQGAETPQCLRGSRTKSDFVSDLPLSSSSYNLHRQHDNV